MMQDGRFEVQQRWDGCKLCKREAAAREITQNCPSRKYADKDMEENKARIDVYKRGEKSQKLK